MGAKGLKLHLCEYVNEPFPMCGSPNVGARSTSSIEFVTCRRCLSVFAIRLQKRISEAHRLAMQVDCRQTNL